MSGKEYDKIPGFQGFLGRVRTLDYSDIDIFMNISKFQ